jgi:hypothetical protein
MENNMENDKKNNDDEKNKDKQNYYVGDCSICMVPMIDINQFSDFDECINKLSLKFCFETEFEKEDYFRLYNIMQKKKKLKYCDFNHYITLNCGHKFHNDCFKKLCKINNNINCPYCRTKYDCYIDFPYIKNIDFKIECEKLLHTTTIDNFSIYLTPYNDYINNDLNYKIDYFNIPKKNVYDEIKSQQVRNYMYQDRRYYPIYLISFEKKFIICENENEENKDIEEILNKYNGRNYIYITHYLRLLLLTGKYDSSYLVKLENTTDNITVYSSNQIISNYFTYKHSKMYIINIVYILKQILLENSKNLLYSDLYNLLAEMIFINIIYINSKSNQISYNTETKENIMASVIHSLIYKYAEFDICCDNLSSSNNISSEGKEKLLSYNNLINYFPLIKKSLFDEFTKNNKYYLDSRYVRITDI